MSIWIRLFYCLSVAAASTMISSPSSAMPPELAVHLLYGSGQNVYTDRAGYTYRVFRVDEDPGLKELIDSITIRLLKTSVGKSLCFDVLEGKPKLLVHHLAMDPLRAKLAAPSCSKSKEPVSVVYDNPNQTPRKLTLHGEDSPRRYVIVVSDNPDLPFDSWTDAYTNQTTLFVHHSEKSSDLNLRHLTQAIAHEMAIYFDAKSWPMGPGWKDIPELAGTKLRSKDDAFVLSAALNPTIATVLAFVRAYKVERMMIRELLSQGLLGNDPIYYPAKDHPFLRIGCAGDCIKSFITDQLPWIAKIQDALLAFSPHYRARRLDILRSTRLPIEDALLNTLEIYPTVFLARLKSDLVALNLVTLDRTPAEMEMQAITNKTMDQILTPADLAALHAEKIFVPKDGVERDLLDYLAQPLLSDSNTGLSWGPRPRIRTGGTL